MRRPGGDGREYAGISSVNSDEKSGRRKPKVSWGRQIRPGLVGPKARPKGVADGQQVNIPVPPLLSDGGTTIGKTTGYWTCRANLAGGVVGKSATHNLQEGWRANLGEVSGRSSEKSL